MSATENKKIVSRLYTEVINQEQSAVIDEIFAPDVVVHDPLSGTSQGIDALKGMMAFFNAAFPGHRATVEALLADGEQVAALHTHTAPNTGSFMGMPPTGKTVVVGGVELFRLRDGKIVEFWRKDDDLGMLMQLGVVSLPQPA
jgi:steroid delta-isomerase-like uncharacterized protein